MGRLFGTDGVRGLANGDLTADLALRLGEAAARVLVGQVDGRRPLAVVGRDTRISGQFLEHAVVAGLASAGVDVLRLRVVPTPGVAYLTDHLAADLGVVISASHNPMPDNGIKLLGRGGHKLDDAVEQDIEAAMDTPVTLPTGADVGRVTPYASTIPDYVGHLVDTLDVRLDGLTVVLDCAHGAAHEAGPKALAAAGARVIPIGDRPDGLNINSGCGSTDLTALRQAVLEHGADAGFAVDGDADRCLAVDHTGQVVDGDQILGLLAVALREQGRLAQDTLVATVMSNLGLHQAMTAAGVRIEQTAVGDRYVLEAMRAGGFSLGGEQSGHVILSRHATTGDGLLTALHVMQWMSVSGRSLRDLASRVRRLPQVLVNVPGVDKDRTDDAELLAAVAAEEAELGAEGRVLLRASGTEPLVRVMVEAPTQERAQAVADRLADVVRARLSLA
ncbi:phosphoglucosamine mutase [uncultured Nocardioides sp.]|uniref:phosphoglucosamine mutase n=1 Tax=uncultured Nocardioides sp. TaxID=198441 RepID=UPI00262A7CD0|nr:phosphoglucosamine mutase [uncultured Nocardioides sp.]